MSTLVDRARATGNPIIEGNTATFVWRGAKPALLEGDFSGWDPAAAAVLRPAGRGVWTHRMTLPRGAYMEYAFFVGDDRRRDPLNAARVTWNGINDYNHYFYMPGGAPTVLAAVSDVPRGTVTRHELPPMWFESARPRIVRLY